MSDLAKTPDWIDKIGRALIPRVSLSIGGMVVETIICCAQCENRASASMSDPDAWFRLLGWDVGRNLCPSCRVPKG